MCVDVWMWMRIHGPWHVKRVPAYRCHLSNSHCFPAFPTACRTFRYNPFECMCVCESVRCECAMIWACSRIELYHSQNNNNNKIGTRSVCSRYAPQPHKWGSTEHVHLYTILDWHQFYLVDCVTIMCECRVLCTRCCRLYRLNSNSNTQ